MFAVLFAGLFVAGGAMAEEKKADAAEKSTVKTKGGASDSDKLKKKRFPSMMRMADDIKRTKESLAKAKAKQKTRITEDLERMTDTWTADYTRAQKKLETAIERAEGVAKAAADKLAALTAKNAENKAATPDMLVATAKRDFDAKRKEADVLLTDLSLLKEIGQLVEVKK